MGGLDLEAFRLLNRLPDALGPVLTPFSTAHDTKGFRLALALLVLAMVARGGRGRRAALTALVAFPLADFLCNQAKAWLPMRRPYHELAGVVSRVGLSDSMGTASSHAANMAAVATAMALVLGPRWGAPWIAAAGLTGLSRVYVGAHYPSQVFLGFAVGIGCGVLVDAVWRRAFRAPSFRGGFVPGEEGVGDGERNAS